MGKLSASVVWTNPISFAPRIRCYPHIRYVWAQRPTEVQKLFEIRPSQNLMAARQLFIYRGNTNNDSLESMMNKKNVSVSGRMKLLMQAPGKRTAVLKDSQESVVHNPRTHFHSSCNKIQDYSKISKLQPCHEEKTQMLSVWKQSSVVC